MFYHSELRLSVQLQKHYFINILPQILFVSIQEVNLPKFISNKGLKWDNDMTDIY